MLRHKFNATERVKESDLDPVRKVIFLHEYFNLQNEVIYPEWISATRRSRDQTYKISTTGIRLSTLIYLSLRATNRQMDSQCRAENK